MGQGIVRGVVQADLDVILHGEVLEQPDVLEGSGNAHLIELIGLFARRVLPIQQDGAPGGMVYVGEQVEHGGLACTVGADQAGDLRAADG